MNFNEEHINFLDLIGKYLSHETNDQEQRLLEEWVSSSAENKITYQRYRKTWDLAELSKSFNSTTPEQEWMQFKTIVSTPKLLQKQAIRRDFNFTKWMVAASIIVLAIFTMWYLVFDSADTEIQSGAHWMAYTLPDQSTVSLNSKSEIVFDQHFNDSQRKVKLNGSAFFEVQPNPEKPFVVEANQVTVTVLGTAFYIRFDALTQTTRIIVDHGKVSVKSQKGDEMVLTTGQACDITDNQDKIQSSDQVSPNFLSWKTKTLDFTQTPLKQVIEDINLAYGCKIEMLDTSIEQIPLTAHYEQKSLQSVLKLIAESLNVQFIPQNDIIIVKP